MDSYIGLDAHESSRTLGPGGKWLGPVPGAPRERCCTGSPESWVRGYPGCLGVGGANDRPANWLTAEQRTESSRTPHSSY